MAHRLQPVIKPEAALISNLVNKESEFLVSELTKADLSNSIHSHVYLNSTERENFKKETGHSAIICSKASTFQHPIQRLTSNWGYEQARKAASRYQRITEVGANMSHAMSCFGSSCNHAKKNKKNIRPVMHFCNLSNNADDSCRLNRDIATMRSMSDPKAVRIVNDISAGQRESPDYCLDGVESCNFRSDVLIFNHSLYDINFETFDRVMEETKAVEAIVVMHAPYEVTYRMETVTGIQSYAISREGSKIHYAVSSSGSKSYVHDEVMWRNWLTRFAFTGKNQYYIKEVIAELGQQWVMRFTATKFQPKFSTTIQPPAFLENYGFFPNFVKIVQEKKDFTWIPEFKHDGTMIGKGKYFICMEGAKLSDCMAAVQRQKSDATNEQAYQTLINQIKAANASIFLGNEPLRRRDGTIDRNLTNIAISIFILGIVHRSRASQYIGEALSRLKKELSDIGKFRLEVSDLLDDIKKLFVGDSQKERLAREQFIAGSVVSYLDPFRIVCRTEPLKVYSKLSLMRGKRIVPSDYSASFVNQFIITNMTTPDKEAEWRANGLHVSVKKNQAAFMYFLQHLHMNRKNTNKIKVAYFGCAPGFSLSSIPRSVLDHFDIIHIDPLECEFPGHQSATFILPSDCDHKSDYCRDCLNERLKGYAIYSDISIGGDPADEFNLQQQMRSAIQEPCCLKFRSCDQVYRQDTPLFGNYIIYAQPYARQGSMEVRVLYDRNNLPKKTLTVKDVTIRMLDWNSRRNREIDEMTFDDMTIYWKEVIESAKEEKIVRPTASPVPIAARNEGNSFEFSNFEVFTDEMEMQSYVRTLKEQCNELDAQLKAREIDYQAHKNLKECKKALIAEIEINLDIGSFKEHSFVLSFHNGIAGEGKSHWIINQGFQKGDFVIAPSNKLKESYAGKVGAVFTYETLFKNIDRVNKPDSTIFVDEALMLPAAWYSMLSVAFPRMKIAAFGDVNQIGFVNRSSNILKPIEWPTRFHNLHTFRCPKDATRRRKLFGYPMATTSSEVEGETVFKLSSNSILEVRGMEIEPEVQIICLYQEDKRVIKELKPECEVNTVHESQGLTTDEVLFVVTKRANLHEDFRYINVADTRHRKKITIISEFPQLRSYFDEEHLSEIENQITEKAEEETEGQHSPDSVEQDQAGQEGNHKDAVCGNSDNGGTGGGASEEEEDCDVVPFNMVDLTKSPLEILRQMRKNKSKPLKTANTIKSSEEGFLTALPIVITIEETKHPDSDQFERVREQVTLGVEEKFVQNDEGEAIINIPSSGDVIDNNDASLPTAGRLELEQISPYLSYDAPMKTTTTTFANVEAINTIIRNSGKQDINQDGGQIKGVQIVGGATNSYLKLRDRAFEVSDGEVLEMQGFMDYHGGALKQGSVSEETTSTFIGRMGKSPVKLSDERSKAIMEVVREHIFDHMPSPADIIRSDGYEDICTRARLDAFIKMDKKDKNVMMQDFDRNTVTALEDYSTKGFNKNQWKAKYLQQLSLKVGQSVSQHSKQKNMVLKFHCYVVDAILREYVGEKPFIYASGRPDQVYEREITRRVKGMELLYVEGDFSEFDSTQNEMMPIICCEILEMFTGIDPVLTATYKQHLADWKVDIPGLLTIAGQNQKHSGEAATLLFNTIWNTAWVSALFDVKDCQVACFKGDDSFIACKEVVMRTEVKRMMEEVGLKLKLSESMDYGTFTDIIINREGAALDVGRRAAKILSKVYKTSDQNCRNDIILATRDLAKQRIVNLVGQYHAIAVNTTVYGSELARNYIEAIINLSNGDFNGVWKKDKVVIVKLPYNKELPMPNEMV